MNLINLNEKIPEYFYIFIEPNGNFLSQIKYHNYLLTRKIISSGYESVLTQTDMLENFVNGDVDYAPYIPADNQLHVPSTFEMTVVNDYTVEYALERYRRMKHKDYPSRFSCVYAFGDYESCVLANKRYGWNLATVKKFALVEGGVEDSDYNKAVKVCKCNMEVVSILRGSSINYIPIDECDKACKMYWEGVSMDLSQCKDEQLYEYLIEGILEEVIE